MGTKNGKISYAETSAFLKECDEVMEGDDEDAKKELEGFLDKFIPADEEEKEMDNEDKAAMIKMAQECVLMVFKFMDEDGSKTVSKSEWAGFFRAKGVPKDAYAALFYAIDVTKNGKLSLAECELWLKKAMEIMDGDDEDAKKSMEELLVVMLC